VSFSSNTLAYFNAATIMTVKYFIAQAPRLIKLGIGELEGMIPLLWNSLIFRARNIRSIREHRRTESVNVSMHFCFRLLVDQGPML
jgi:hypothetical protein